MFWAFLVGFLGVHLVWASVMATWGTRVGQRALRDWWASAPERVKILQLLVYIASGFLAMGMWRVLRGVAT